jgi:hypothetical protein
MGICAKTSGMALIPTTRKLQIIMQGLVITFHYGVSQLKTETATIFQGNSIGSYTMIFKHSNERLINAPRHVRDIHAEGDIIYTPPIIGLGTEGSIAP